MKKNTFIAILLNFFVWGLGYFYLNKKENIGVIAIILYVIIIIFSVWYISWAGLLVFAGIYWIIFWSLWISIFLAYDVYKISTERKIVPLKIEKVKMRKRKGEKK